MASAGASGTDGKVDAAQMEDGGEVHVYRRVHRLEDEAGPQQLRVMLFRHDIGALNDGLGRRVVAEDDAHLVGQEIRFVDAGVLKRLACCHESIFALFRQTGTQTPVQQLLKFGARHDACQRALVAVANTLCLNAYA